MKTTVTTREFDEQGRVVREVVTETEDNRLNVGRCTCSWRSNYCPLHGFAYGQAWPPGTIICSDATTSNTVSINSEDYPPRLRSAS